MLQEDWSFHYRGIQPVVSPKLQYFAFIDEQFSVQVMQFRADPYIKNCEIRSDAFSSKKVIKSKEQEVCLIRKIVFSSEEKLIAFHLQQKILIFSTDGEFVDELSKKLLGDYFHDLSEIKEVTWLPSTEKQQIAVIDKSKCLMVYDVFQKEVKLEIQADSAEQSIVFLPYGQQVLVGFLWSDHSKMWLRIFSCDPAKEWGRFQLPFVLVNRVEFVNNYLLFETGFDEETSVLRLGLEDLLELRFSQKDASLSPINQSTSFLKLLTPEMVDDLTSIDEAKQKSKKLPDRQPIKTMLLPHYTEVLSIGTYTGKLFISSFDHKTSQHRMCPGISRGADLGEIDYFLELDKFYENHRGNYKRATNKMQVRISSVKFSFSETLFAVKNGQTPNQVFILQKSTGSCKTVIEMESIVKDFFWDLGLNILFIVSEASIVFFNTNTSEFFKLESFYGKIKNAKIGKDNNLLFTTENSKCFVFNSKLRN